MSGGREVNLRCLASGIQKRPPHVFGKLVNMRVSCFDVLMVFEIFAGKAGKNFI